MNSILAATIRVLMAAEKPLDSYQVAKRTGHTPMEAGRALLELRWRGQVHAVDTGGDQQLVEEFKLVHTS